VLPVVGAHGGASPVAAGGALQGEESSGVGDEISRVSHIFAWNWHEAKLPEVENGLNPTTNFQGSDKQAGV
jgi:hypothetical protein